MQANLKSRLVTAAFGIPLLVVLVGWAPHWLFATVFFLITVAVLREFYAIAFPGRARDQGLAVLFGGCVALLVLASDGRNLESGLSLVLIILIPFHLFASGRVEERLSRLAWTLLGGLYLGLLLPHWVILFDLPNGRKWVFFVLSVVMAGDSIAYFVGNRFGSRKLSPDISPAKTVEGAWGYLLGSLTAGICGSWYLLGGYSWLEVCALAISLSLLGQLGDLFESSVKRAFAVKDSGTLLPGHGGLLDRIDSLILPAVFVTSYVKAFHS